MNSVTNLAINWTEQGLVPDAVIRAGIAACASSGWPKSMR